MERTYICIDLKSFYASVECVERGLNPMTTNLVVADPERSDKTICLAVSPSMKALGVKNRCRVFEIPPGIDYIMATPRMQKYIDYAAKIYGVYLDHISPDDIYVYSIDEAFIDITPYMSLYGKDGKSMAVMLMEEIWKQVGVRATAGVGTNLYLAKIALDITAKHAADFIGVLDEKSYVETLWDHRPLTDFWRIGPGIAKKLARYGIYDQRGIALADEDFLYRLFGVDAELLIDHAWGREPVTMADIKAYRPKSSSISSGQVLMRDYAFDEGRIVAKEMAESLCLSLVRRNSVCSNISMFAGYANHYGVQPSFGSVSFDPPTNSRAVIVPKIAALYDRIVDPEMRIRRFNFSCNNVTEDSMPVQLSFFDTAETESAKEEENTLQKTVLSIKDKYGKNAMFKGLDLQEGATTRERNSQIGGHKSGEKK